LRASRGAGVSWRVAAICATALTAASCSNGAPESDQIAQRWWIGRSAHQIKTCLGAPVDRKGFDDASEIWTYRMGALRGDGPLSDLAHAAPPSDDQSRASCEIRVIMTKGRVSQVAYRSADGRALPLENRCEFAVARCERLP
jgi:hypothetical protein